MGDNWDIEEAASWTVTNSQCSKKYSVTRCGKTQILGGYECLANKAEISRSFTLPHHWSIYIKVSFWLIDSWDSESLIMKLGNIQITELRDHSPSDDNLCGATSNWLGLNKEAYLDRKYDKTLENNPHYERQVTAVFTSNLDGKADDESFGINNFQLLIDPCNPTCNQCLMGPESFNCLNCWDNATFIKYRDDYVLCTCSSTEFYYAQKGKSCKKNCPITNTFQGFCKCNQGYYTVSKNVPCSDPVCTECKKCDTSCKDCSGPGPTSCVTCADNLYKQTYKSPDVPSSDLNFGKTICQSKCLNESYFIDQVRKECIKCHPSCKTCNGELSQECLSCPNGFYLDGNDIGGGVYVGGCVSSCSQGYYKNNSTKRCMRCNLTCIDCKDDQPDYCTECKTKLLLLDGICYDNCPDGYWNDTPNKMCRKCDVKCKTCLGSSTFCTSCTGNYYFLEKQNNCLNNACPDGMYKYKNTYNGLNFCYKCHSNCLTCDNGNQDNCLSCDPAIGFLKGSICSTCNLNQYGDTKDQICKPCNSQCATCEGPNQDQCRSCTGSLYLSDKNCSLTCQDTTYPDTLTNKCTQCDSTCQNCTNAGPDSCSSCPSGRYLKGSSCLTSCNPKGEYPDNKNNACGICHAECLKCKDETQQGCTECSSNKYLQANSCVDNCLSDLFGFEETKQCLKECPEGYYGDLKSKKCVKCEAFCPVCKSAGFTNCQKCAGDLFLQDSSCLTQCKTGFYPDITDNKCKKCHETCLECSGETKNNCTKCQSNLYFGQNTCYTKCPNNQYGNQVTMECVQECPLGTYGNQNENLCRGCHSNCMQCYGPSFSQCLKCNLGSFLFDSTCDMCPSGYFKNEQTRKCDPCFDNCTQCDGGSPSDCLKCTLGYYHLKEKKMCVSTCPDPFFSEDNNPDCILSCSQSNQYGNPITRQCEDCHAFCKQCFGPGNQNCKSCQINYLFLESKNICTKKCPQGYYENYISFTCDPCDKSCQTCYGRQPDQCLSCQEPNFLHQNYCTNSCPQNLYKDLDKLQCVEDCSLYKPNRFANKLSGMCQICNSACQKCTGPSNKECSVCNSSHLLLENNCIESCPLGYYAVYKDPNSKNQINQPVTDDCMKCHKNCQDCFGPSENECRTCTKGLYTFSPSSSDNIVNQKKQCVTKCPDQYIVNEQKMSCEICPPYTYFENGVCKDCHYSCLKCSGQTQFDCILCSSERSVQEEDEPVNGQCNCKQGYMETFSHECDQLPVIAKTVNKSVFVSLMTSISCSIITGLLSSSAFSFHQLVEVSQFTGSLKFANVTYPLNINFLFESVSSDQSNKIFEKSSSSKQKTSNLRILMSQSDMLQLKDDNESPQLWKQFIFTLVINISSWLIVLILNLAVIHMKVKYDQSQKLEKLRVILQYTLPIQAFLRTSQEVFMFIFLSAYFSTSLDVFGWINFVYLSITMLFVFAIIIKISVQEVYEKKRNQADKSGEYLIAVKGKKNKIVNYPHPLRTLLYFFKDNKFARNYYSLSLLFKLINIFSLVFTSNLVIQMIVMIVTKVLFISYIMICKPYKINYYNHINIFNETLSCTIPLTILIMHNTEKDESNYNLFGWLIMIEMLFLFLFNFVYAVFEIVMVVKIYISKKLKNSKKFAKINSEKISNSVDQSVDNQSILFDKSVVKNMTLRGGNDHNIFQQQNTPQKQDSKKDKIKVLQITQNYQQTSNQSMDGQVIKQNTIYPQSTIEIDKYQLENTNLYQRPKSSCQQERDEDYNIKDQSILRDDDQYLNENDDNMGFPLSVYGKQLENDQNQSTIKRKKKNKKKDDQKVCFVKQNEEDTLNQKQVDNQANLIDATLLQNTYKSKQEEDNDDGQQKQQNISQIKENVGMKQQKSLDDILQEKHVSERSSLDLIKVIESESNSFSLQKQLSIQQKLENIQSNSQNKGSGNFEETQGEIVITEVISKQKNGLLGSGYDRVLNSSRNQREDKSLKVIDLQQEQKQAQQKTVLEDTQILFNKQISKQKEISNKVVDNSNLQDSQSNKFNNDSKLSDFSEKDNITFKKGGLFGGISEFKIKRVVQSKTTNSSPMKQAKNNISSEKQHQSKSILEFIKQKVVKQNLFKEQN